MIEENKQMEDAAKLAYIGMSLPEDFFLQSYTVTTIDRVYNKISLWEHEGREYVFLFSEDFQTVMVNYPIDIPMKIPRAYFPEFIKHNSGREVEPIQPRLIHKDDLELIRQALAIYEVCTIFLGDKYP